MVQESADRTQPHKPEYNVIKANVLKYPSCKRRGVADWPGYVRLADNVCHVEGLVMESQAVDDHASFLAPKRGQSSLPRIEENIVHELKKCHMRRSALQEERTIAPCVDATQNPYAKPLTIMQWVSNGEEFQTRVAEVPGSSTKIGLPSAVPNWPYKRTLS